MISGFNACCFTRGRVGMEFATAPFPIGITNEKRAALWQGGCVLACVASGYSTTARMVISISCCGNARPETPMRLLATWGTSAP